MFRWRRIVEAGKHEDLGSIERNFLPDALEIQKPPPSVIPAKAGIQGSPASASSLSHFLSPGVPAKRVVGRAGEREASALSGHPERSEGSHSKGWVEGSATHQSIYKMRLKLAKNWLMVDGRKVELISGMAVSAEVKTGKRRLIEFFLSPLVQHVDESVRER